MITMEERPDSLWVLLASSGFLIICIQLDYHQILNFLGGVFILTENWKLTTHIRITSWSMVLVEID